MTTIGAVLGLERIKEAKEILKDQRDRVDSSNLGKDEKTQIRDSLTASIENLSLGTVAAQLAAASRVETGEDPAMREVHQLLAKKMVEGLKTENANPGNALVERLLFRLADQIPLAGDREERVDAVRAATDEVVAKVLTQTLGNAMGSHSDPLRETLDDELKLMMASAIAKMKEPPPGFAEQIRGAVGTIEGAKTVLAGFGLGAPPPPDPALITQQTNIQLEKLKVEERLGMHRIDVEKAIDLEKAKSMGKIADLLSGAIGTVGQTLGRMMMSGDLGEEPAPARRQLPQAQTLTCPNCNENAIQVSAEIAASVQGGGGPHSVTCDHCGATHTVGGDGADAPPARPPTPEAEEELEEPAVSEHVTVNRS